MMLNNVCVGALHVLLGLDDTDLAIHYAVCTVIHAPLCQSITRNQGTKLHTARASWNSVVSNMMYGRQLQSNFN